MVDFGAYRPMPPCDRNLLLRGQGRDVGRRRYRDGSRLYGLLKLWYALPLNRDGAFDGTLSDIQHLGVIRLT